MTIIPTRVPADHPDRTRRAQADFRRNVNARARAANLPVDVVTDVVAAEVAEQPIRIDYDTFHPGDVRPWSCEEFEAPDGARQVRIVLNLSHRATEFLWRAFREAGMTAQLEVFLATLAMMPVDMDDRRFWDREINEIGKTLDAAFAKLEEWYPDWFEYTDAWDED